MANDYGEGDVVRVIILQDPDADGKWQALTTPGSGGGGGGAGTQYVEDAAAIDAATGTAVLAVRKDTPAALTSADGDWATLTVDASNRLRVVNDQAITANIGTSGSLALDATLTGGNQKTKIVDSGGVNVATVTAAGAQKVDGSAVTQPVSGTFWQATQPVSGTVTANIGTSGSLALDATLTGGTQKTKIVDSAGTNVAAVSAAGAVKVDGSAVTQPVSGTFWQATQPVSGTFWQATQPVSIAATVGTNLAQVAGTTTDTNSGNKSAGTQRVVLATDQPQLTSPMPVGRKGVALVSTPAISSGVAYTAGDVVGAANTLTGAALVSGGACLLAGVKLTDRAKANAALEAWVFKVSPTLVNVDNGAFDITDANLETAKLVCIVDFRVGDYKATSSGSACQGTINGARPEEFIITSGSANLFYALVTRSAPTYGSTADLVLEFTLEQY